MPRKPAPKVPLPRHWKNHVKGAILHVISLAQYATAYTRSWAADSTNARVRLTAENRRLEQEIGLLREDLRIKDARLARIARKWDWLRSGRSVPVPIFGSRPRS